MMPEVDKTMLLAPMPGWRPVQHEKVDITNWQWKNYPILYALDLKAMVKDIVKKKEEE
jgi:hypothetical protein